MLNNSFCDYSSSANSSVLGNLFICYYGVRERTHYISKKNDGPFVWKSIVRN